MSAHDPKADILNADCQHESPAINENVGIVGMHNTCVVRYVRLIVAMRAGYPLLVRSVEHKRP